MGINGGYLFNHKHFKVTFQSLSDSKFQDNYIDETKSWFLFRKHPFLGGRARAKESQAEETSPDKHYVCLLITAQSPVYI